jgi:hypothetical protein
MFRGNLTYLPFGIILLVSLTLTFNTLHTHKDLDWDRSQHSTELAHSLEVDENVCPVCGYLTKLDTVDSTGVCLYLKAIEVVVEAPLLLADDLSLLPVNGRSPPSQV